METKKDTVTIPNNSKFDAHSPIPLYHQVYTFIRQLILDENYASGNLLPPEIALAKNLNVSRHTIRQAMSLLVSEGLIERFSGKGTFISKKNPRNQFFLDKSFSQQMADLGMQTHAKVLELSHGVINKTTSVFFHKKLGAPYLKLTRLRFGDQDPIGLQTALVITENCPDLGKHDFSHQSLFHLLTTEYKLEISEIFHTVNAVLASEYQADLLQVEVGAPLLYEKSVTFLSDGEPIETTTSYFSAEKYEYSVRFQYTSNKSIWQSF